MGRRLIAACSRRDAADSTRQPANGPAPTGSEGSWGTLGAIRAHARHGDVERGNASVGDFDGVEHLRRRGRSHGDRTRCAKAAAAVAMGVIAAVPMRRAIGRRVVVSNVLLRARLAMRWVRMRRGRSRTFVRHLDTKPTRSCQRPLDGEHDHQRDEENATKHGRKVSTGESRDLSFRPRRPAVLFPTGLDIARPWRGRDAKGAAQQGTGAPRIGSYRNLGPGPSKEGTP
jgi:hypothetical protein